MPLLPLYGHRTLQDRFRSAVRGQSLPGSVLLQGPRGVGKQQLGLWLARLLLCENADRAPCESCQGCRMARAAQHPDLHWVFPRPRLKDSNPDVATVRADIAEGIAERLENDGLYAPAGGDAGIFVSTVRAIVQTATMSPAMGRRKIVVIGDAERMVAQKGSDQAANAFLKLLEEPPADTTLILSSSEPGALLPTIRSRVVAVRVAPLREEDMRAFLADVRVANQIDAGPRTTDELIELASGAPGTLVGRESWQAAVAQASRVLDAATSRDRAQRMRVSLGQGASGARGRYSDTLDALTVLLHDRARDAARQGDTRLAAGAARAVDAVERAKERAGGNVNPQLVTAALLDELSSLVQ